MGKVLIPPTETHTRVSRKKREDGHQKTTPEGSADKWRNCLLCVSTTHERAAETERSSWCNPLTRRDRVVLSPASSPIRAGSVLSLSLSSAAEPKQNHLAGLLLRSVHPALSFISIVRKRQVSCPPSRLGLCLAAVFPFRCSGWPESDIASSCAVLLTKRRVSPPCPLPISVLLVYVGTRDTM